MAGFAVNIKLLHKRPNATIIYKAGYEEDTFLKDLLVDYDEIQAKADNCTQVNKPFHFLFKSKVTKPLVLKILVWHTKTVQIPQRKIKPPKEKPEHVLSSINGLLYALDKLKLAIISKKGNANSYQQLINSDLLYFYYRETEYH